MRRSYVREYSGSGRKVDNTGTGGIIEADGQSPMYHASIAGEDRSGFRVISDERFEQLVSPERKAGAIIIRNDPDWNRRLKEAHATAETLGDVMIFGPDLCISDVLEEKRHFWQNQTDLHADKTEPLRTILNEIEAREWILDNSGKYQVPRNELDSVKRHLDRYYKQLEEYNAGVC